jgi:signal transduction histidine kinase
MRFSGAGRPPTADLLVAAALLVAALTEVWVTRTAPGPQGMGTAVALLSAGPLAWRRVRPLIAVGGAVSAILLPLVSQPPVETDGLAVLVAWLIAVHAVNAYGPQWSAWLGTLAVLAANALVIAYTPPPPGQTVGSMVWAWTLALFGTAAAAGQIMRHLAARLVSERAVAEADARAVERSQLARELHDVVAHGVAVMVVQAGAAQELVHTAPDRASALLDAVQRAGEQSAAELRRMLDLLGADHPELEPQPRLADLPGLVAEVRAAGLLAELDSPTVIEDIPPGLQAAAYRVVQESLTNALKHGSRSAVVVRIRADLDVLTVVVDDEGGVSAGPSSTTTPGRGLHGLQERVRLYGGTLQAGRAGSGWRVQAALPLASGPSPESGRRVLPIDPETVS